MGSYLVPFDFSAGAISSIRYAATSLQLNKAEDHVYVLHVIDVPYSGPQLSAVQIKKHEEVVQKDIIKHMEPHMQPFRDHHISYSIIVQRGDPREVIIKEAENKKVLTIIIGARGLGRISKLFLGSVSDYVVKHARCNVIIVRDRS
eukprot:Colp12_sorted_trinity150504_noHs@22941